MSLRKAAPERPVIVVSSLDEPRVIRAALAAGAAGFVPKHSRRELFRAAFAAIARGEVFVPESAGAALEAAAPEGAQEEAIRRLSQLTRQQANILEQICAGKMNKQIAFDLSLSERTVKMHRSAVFRSLGVRTSADAIRIAIEAGF